VKSLHVSVEISKIKRIGKDNLITFYDNWTQISAIAFFIFQLSSYNATKEEPKRYLRNCSKPLKQFSNIIDYYRKMGLNWNNVVKGLSMIKKLDKYFKEISKYQNGKIYRIHCNITGKDYIGSTIYTLAKRLGDHIANYRRWLDGKSNRVSSFEILQCGDYEIILIEDYPCKSKLELLKRERYWCTRMDCVNKVKNQGAQLEMGIMNYQKQYWKNHKAEKRIYDKTYTGKHRSEIKNYHSKYYNEHKEKVKEDYKTNIYEKRAYYQKRKEEIKARTAIPFHCVCGSTCRTGDKSKHYKTAKHQSYTTQLQA
jgi:hypothetical protein